MEQKVAELEKLLGEREQIEAQRLEIEAKAARLDAKADRLEKMLTDVERELSWYSKRSLRGLNWVFFVINIGLAALFIASTARNCLH